MCLFRHLIPFLRRTTSHIMEAIVDRLIAIVTSSCSSGTLPISRSRSIRRMAKTTNALSHMRMCDRPWLFAPSSLLVKGPLWNVQNDSPDFRATSAISAIATTQHSSSPVLNSRTESSPRLNSCANKITTPTAPAHTNHTRFGICIIF